ncbi:uncharacterized protein V1516DRAFT_681896 [Lipomyces oligophaga]|uniref:uncharacterized protein n=1 Tax=Lipomyces oligophaga TaxID=45792 RepID=UPI0034CFCC38
MAFWNSNPTSELSETEKLKQLVETEIRNESGLAVTKDLFESMSSECFDRCFVVPGSAVTATDAACLDSCVKKYIAGFDIVLRSYAQVIKRQSSS